MVIIIIAIIIFIFILSVSKPCLVPSDLQDLMCVCFFNW